MLRYNLYKLPSRRVPLAVYTIIYFPTVWNNEQCPNAGLQCTVYNATKNKLLIKFVKGALELTEIFSGSHLKWSSFLVSYYTALQTTAFSRAYF